MTTYVLQVYGVTDETTYTKEVEASSLNHAALKVKAMDVKGWMAMTLKVKGAKRSYMVQSLDGWYSSFWHGKCES